MSKPITAKRFLELCDLWSIKYIPVHSNWASHNRNHKGEWNDLNGVMLHHTGPFSSVNQMSELLWDGYSALPGPLCHAGIDPAGILRLAGWGRANHAGLGSESTLEAVRASKYPPGNIAPGPAKIDGNVHFYGFEIMADGQTPITDAQRVTAIRVSAALCLEHKWGPDVIGHGEWQQGKWDVGAHGKLIDFSKVRNEVKQAMKEGPTQNPSDTVITVKKGDTLFSLAKKYYPGHGVDGVIELLEDNPQLLQPGMKLTIKK